MKIDFNDTADLVLTHPVTGEDLYDDDGHQSTITIYGSESSQYRQAMNQSVNKRLARPESMSTAEQATTDGLDLLTACTASINYLDLGKGLVETKDAKRTYRDVSWLKDQVSTGITNKALFLVAESKKQKRT